MRSDRGSVTIWMLGLSVLLLLFGGLTIDFWRGLALQRALSTVADSAAVAAASGVNVEVYRTTGEVVLDPNRAATLAGASIRFQDLEPELVDIAVSGDQLSVSIVVEDDLELGLLGLFVDQSEPLRIRASATATPVLVP